MFRWLQSLPIHLIIILLLLLMALPAIGLIIHAGLQDRRADLDESVRASTYLTSSIARDIENRVEASRQLMEMLSLLPAVRERNAPEVRRLLADLLEKHAAYSNILLADRRGTVWAAGRNDSKPVNLADRQAFRDALSSGKFSAGEYIIGRTTLRPVLNFGFPLRNRAGEVDGAILIGLSLDYFGNLFRSYSLPPGTSFGIFDRNGTFIYRTVSAGKFIGKKDRPENFERMKKGPDEGVLELVSADGIRRQAAYRKLRLSSDLAPYAYIRGGTPIEIAQQQASRSLIKNIAAMGMVLMAVFALTLLISRRLIVRRIEALQRASRSLAGGDLQVRVTEKVRGGELGNLGAAFDEMAGALARELEERSRREEVLREKSELLDLAHDAIILRDLGGAVRFWNRGAEQMYGYAAADAAGKISHDLLATRAGESLAEIFDETLASGRWEGKLVHTARDGHRVTVSSRWVLQRDREGNPWRIMEINSDITEQERVQNELVKMQKLESLGVLAGGIAHHFNNILTGVMGNISLARSITGHQDRIAKLLEQAEKSCLRAAQLASRLVTFARGGEPVKRPVNIRHLLDRCIGKCAATGVRSEIRSGNEVLQADEGQLTQAISNLLDNAVEAMPDGGDISISVDRVTLEPSEVGALVPGSYVRLRVSDTGCGIPEANMEKIFDPYFTTKPNGEGLGLAVVHSIVVRHGGSISVSSQERQGASFEILLPAPDASGEPEGAPEKPEGEKPRHQRILVMDDEQIIRDLLSEMLVELGYPTATCPDGQEAVRLYQEAVREGSPFAAVILDLQVPHGVGGLEASRAILEQDPDACLLVSSGYSADPVVAHPGHFGFRAAMIKPYSMDEVGDVVKRLLG